VCLTASEQRHSGGDGHPLPRAAVVAAGCVALTGCATALSTSQPAHVPEPGHFQTEAGLDVSVSSGSIRKVIRAAESLEEASAQRELTDAEKRTIVEGGAHLALNPPAVIPHLGVAYAPLNRWELGLRFAATGWRLGMRRQLLLQEQHDVDLTLGGGVGCALFTPPVNDVLETLTIKKFSRWNFDLLLSLGRHGSWYRWWIGPHLLYSRMSQTMSLALPREVTITGSVSGNAFYMGGHAGTAFGYQSVFVGPELMLVQLMGDAEVTVLGSTTGFSVSSFIVYPAFAVMGEF
jgi:hypothetical protein